MYNSDKYGVKKETGQLQAFKKKLKIITTVMGESFLEIKNK